MIRFLTILFLLSVSCFAQVKQWHLTNTTGNVQEQINARAVISGTNSLSSSLIWDGNATNAVEFSDLSTFTISPSSGSFLSGNLYLTNSPNARITATNAWIEARSSFRLYTPGIYGGSVETGYVLRLSDDSDGSAEYAPIKVDNVSGLKSFPTNSVPDGWIVKTLGYYTDGDGGEGVYRYFASSTETPNDGTIIDPTYLPGRFHLLNSGSTNVRQFGAVGDGSSDDTAKFQAALDWAKLPYETNSVYSVRSGRIFIPKGRYRLTAKVTVHPGMTITGESQESTHLVPEHLNDDVLYCETPDGSSSTMIRSYAFDGFSIVQKIGTTPTNGAAIRVRPQTITGGISPVSVASRLSIRNVYIYGTYRGLHATAIQGGTVDGLNVFYCRETGVLFDAYQTLLQVRGSASSANGAAGSGHGWRLDGPSYVSFTGTSADSNAGYGYYLVNSTEQSCYANTLDVGAEGNNTGGIYLSNQINARVTALCIMDSGAVAQDGITVNGSVSRVLLLNCHIPTQSSCTGYALKVTSGPEDGSASVTVNGGFFGLFNAGANIVTSTTPINWSGYQSANRIGYGLLTTPSRPFELNRRTYAAGTASREVARFSDISTDNAGSAHISLTADSGNTLFQLEQNSVAASPFGYSTTLGDTILRNSYTSSAGQFGNFKFIVGNSIGLTIGNGTRRGQVAVGTQTIDTSATFQVDSTTGGILLPRMTKAQRDAIGTPANGLMIYQTDGTAGVKARIGGAWHTLNTTADP